MKKLLAYLVLPPEISEFERHYLARLNRIALVFFAGHLPLFVCVARALAGTSVLQTLVLTPIFLIGPFIAYHVLINPRHLSLVFGFTAMCMGGLLVHFGKGPMQIEMHFYFFTLIALLAVFGNPIAIVTAAVTVALHHLVLFLILPSSVFNYRASIWAVGVHGAFVALESVAACFVARSFFDNVIGLEKIVKKRTDDLRLVLDNVGQGFLTINLDGTLAAERSAIVDTWFGPFVPGTRFWEYVAGLEPGVPEWFRLGWEAVVRGTCCCRWTWRSGSSLKLVEARRALDSSLELPAGDGRGQAVQGNGAGDLRRHRRSSNANATLSRNSATSCGSSSTSPRTGRAFRLSSPRAARSSPRSSPTRARAASYAARSTRSRETARSSASLASPRFARTWNREWPRARPSSARRIARASARCRGRFVGQPAGVARPGSDQPGRGGPRRVHVDLDRAGRRRRARGDRVVHPGVGVRGRRAKPRPRGRPGARDRRPPGQNRRPRSSIRRRTACACCRRAGRSSGRRSRTSSGTPSTMGSRPRRSAPWRASLRSGESGWARCW